MPVKCFPEATAPVSQSRRRRVSFAEEVTTQSADEWPELSPVSPPLILPVISGGGGGRPRFGNWSDATDPAGGRGD